MCHKETKESIQLKKSLGVQQIQEGFLEEAIPELDLYGYSELVSTGESMKCKNQQPFKGENFKKTKKVSLSLFPHF